MATRFGQAFWPGVKGFISCSYTCGHGSQPGVATLEIPEQNVSRIEQFGNLVITDGHGTVAMRRAKVGDIQFLGGGSTPRTIALHILDRRWGWAFGSISGNWNQIDPYPDPDSLPDGEFIAAGGPYMPGTYRTAEKLMQDCFKAMHETHPFIDPSPSYPIPVQWSDEVPAQALSNLADELGMRVIYQPCADRVLVALVGVGAEMPDLPAVSISASVDLPERPNGMYVVGGNTIYNDWLRLEPVGMEKNGAIKPIDDLSYRPAGGWSDGTAVPPYFGGVPAGTDMTRDQSIEMAQQCIWRMFRPSMQDLLAPNQLGIDVPGYGRVIDRKQIVLGNQVYFSSKNVMGQPMTEAAYIIGEVFFSGNDFPNDQVQAIGAAVRFGNTSISGPRLPLPFSIDAARGLVTFGRHMTKRVNFRTIAPVLYLRTGFSIRSAAGLVPDKYYYGGPLPGSPDATVAPEVIRRPDLVRVVNIIRRTNDASFALVDQGDNSADLDPQADYYIRGALARYAMDAAAEATYAGIVPIDPDGAIQQVTWTVGGGQPATTRVSRNSEHQKFLPAYPELRRNEKIREFIGKRKAADAGANAPVPDFVSPGTAINAGLQ